MRSGAREESVVERLEASTPLENISQFDQRFQNSMEIKNESKQFETYVSGESENKSRWENTTMDMGWDGSKNGRTKTASS